MRVREVARAWLRKAVGPRRPAAAPLAGRLALAGLAAALLASPGPGPLRAEPAGGAGAGAGPAAPRALVVEHAEATSLQDAQRQINADPLCLVCPCKAEERVVLTPVGLDLLLDQSTSALGIRRGGGRDEGRGPSPDERNRAVGELGRYVDEAARAQRVTQGDAGRRFIRTKNVLSLRGNYSPIARSLRETSERAEALVVMTDGLEDEGPGSDEERDCRRACAGKRDGLACLCGCRRKVLVDQVRATLAMGRHLFWVTFPPARRADECSPHFGEATRQIDAACAERRRPAQGAGSCRHVVLAATDLRDRRLAAVEARVDGPLKEFFDVVRRQTQSFGVTRALPREPGALAIGDGRRFRCSAAPVAPDVLLAAAHCLPATRALVEDEASGQRRVLAIVDVARAPAPGADAALLRVKTDEPLFVPPRRRARDDAPPPGVLRLFGHGERPRTADAGPGLLRSFVDLPAAGWGCDGRRVGQTGCTPGLDLVLLGGPGRDACLGDRGGPVYELVGEGREGGSCGWRLVGVGARPAGDPRAACGSGALATRVDALDPWIERTLAAWKRPRSP
ncbi:MAG TPA: hypothetical protein VFS43_25730 [Polyangiaceae bacterium]|nr:hypothetical protein [Polyangiaceae bacterium]